MGVRKGGRGGGRVVGSRRVTERSKGGMEARNWVRNTWDRSV